ncbi:hypothetical protein NEIELOOT_02069 [Neisseria elongata subsp. glycolytica ATCC 29315]|uniref:Uncharacterized protein n=1 Tax=Neisseria elongata subsp. glycolytica ATCC 29315 TaxID=546263 RepID=D4DSM4_NEIEG|nr:hypothetical protein NEIELOOT_02069 [Neisseria elongata subsp. glycolytica ATCC 29315]
MLLFHMRRSDGEGRLVCVLRFVCCDVRPSEKRKRFFRRPFAAV